MPGVVEGADRRRASPRPGGRRRSGVARGRRPDAERGARAGVRTSARSIRPLSRSISGLRLRVVAERAAHVAALARARRRRRRRACSWSARRPSRSGARLGPCLEARGLGAGVEERVPAVEARVELGELRAGVRAAGLLAGLRADATSRASGWGSLAELVEAVRVALEAGEAPDGLAGLAARRLDRVAGVRLAARRAAARRGPSAPRGGRRRSTR